MCGHRAARLVAGRALLAAAARGDAAGAVEALDTLFAAPATDLQALRLPRLARDVHGDLMACPHFFAGLALQLAAQRGHTDVLRALIGAGAQLDFAVFG